MTHSTPQTRILEQLSGLARSLPQRLTRNDLADLAALLQYTEHGCWAFALYNTLAAREDVLSALRRILDPLPILEHTLTSEQPNPLAYLARLEKTARHKRTIVFFFDLEHAGEEALGLLEYERETLAAYPHGLVFWVTPAGRVTAARQAPNFWAQRSGVFDFTIAEEPSKLASLRGVWAGVPVQLDSPNDWERQMRQFTDLLDEYQRNGEATPAQLAELHGKIAYLLYVADRYDEAVSHLKMQLVLTEQASGRSAQAWQAIGGVQNFRKELDAALTKYQATLRLYRAVGGRHGEANVLKAMGDAQNFMDNRDAALASYQQALTLYRAVGNQLGEAGVLKAMGDVQNFRKEIEAALASYQHALALYRAVGASSEATPVAALSEANVLQAMGDMQRVCDDHDAALASYRQALALYRTLGASPQATPAATLGEANVLQAIGAIQRFHNERDAALASYQQALALYRAVGDRLGEADVLLSTGHMALDVGDEQQGVERLRYAAQLYEAIGDQSDAANVRTTLARHAAAQGELRAAIDYMQPAADFCKGIYHPLGDQLQAQIDTWQRQLESGEAQT